jgi:hypothetical protein
MVWQFVATAISKLLFFKLVIPTIEAKQPLSELDGLTVWHESRLEEEDVENVPNMSTVDVVDTMLHTQIPAERLISWIDQAILYSVLGPDAGTNNDQTIKYKLRSYGLRSASQVVETYKDNNTSLENLIGENKAKVLVRALEIEANFDIVRCWRRI